MLWAVAIDITAAPGTTAHGHVLTLKKKRAIEKAVCNYLLAHPDIVFDARKILDSRQRASKANQARRHRTLKA